MKIIRYEDILTRKNLELIEKIIKADGLIVYPTDTLYGLGGNFLSLPVVKRVDELKQRSDMPYSAAVSGIAMIRRLTAEIPPLFYELFPKLFPGKFTCLLKVSTSLNSALVKQGDKIGIRVPQVPGILKLIETMNTPLISSSVNRSGQKPLRDPGTIQKEFPEVELMIDAGVLPLSKGSTVIDLTESPVKVIRKGDDFTRLSQLNIDIS